MLADDCTNEVCTYWIKWPQVEGEVLFKLKNFKLPEINLVKAWSLKKQQIDSI